MPSYESIDNSILAANIKIASALVNTSARANTGNLIILLKSTQNYTLQLSF